MPWLAVGLVFLASATLTGLVRAVAHRVAAIDVPNARSMHAVPTPRGGGLSFVLTTLVFIAWTWATGLLAARVAAALLGGGALVALVGWLDDRKPLSNAVRLPLWGASAAWAALWLGGLPSLDVPPFQVPLGLVGVLLASVGLVWMINLYNFMDGIDGLAATEAVLVAGAAALLLGGTGEGAVAAAIAAGAAGFLLWNWPRARIFMGDVGSGFLGFMFGALALATENAGTLPLLAWLLLLGVFVTDTALTVVRRMARGEKWYEAHRGHAYQRAARLAGRHLPVTLVASALTLALVLATLLTPRAWLSLAAVLALATLAGAWAWVQRSARSLPP